MRKSSGNISTYIFNSHSCSERQAKQQAADSSRAEPTNSSSSICIAAERSAERERKQNFGTSLIDDDDGDGDGREIGNAQFSLSVSNRSKYRSQAGVKDTSKESGEAALSVHVSLLREIFFISFLFSTQTSSSYDTHTMKSSSRRARKAG